MANTHPSDDAIERFAMNRLAEPELTQFEEHLLICSHCQEQVAKTDAIIRGLRVATQRLEVERHVWPGMVRQIPGVAWAAAAALLLVIYFVAPRSSTPPQTIALAAMRGDSAPAARSQVALNLQLDATGLPAAAAHRVDVVDSAGEVVASKAAKLSNGRIDVGFRGLSVGQYWIRVYAGSTLVREYSLLVK